MWLKGLILSLFLVSVVQGDPTPASYDPITDLLNCPFFPSRKSFGLPPHLVHPDDGGLLIFAQTPDGKGKVYRYSLPVTAGPGTSPLRQLKIELPGRNYLYVRDPGLTSKLDAKWEQSDKPFPGSNPYLTLAGAELFPPSKEWSSKRWEEEVKNPELKWERLRIEREFNLAYLVGFLKVRKALNEELFDLKLLHEKGKLEQIKSASYRLRTKLETCFKSAADNSELSIYIRSQVLLHRFGPDLLRPRTEPPGYGARRHGEVPHY